MIQGRAKETDRTKRKQGHQAWGWTERIRALRTRKLGAGRSNQCMLGNPVQDDASMLAIAVTTPAPATIRVSNRLGSGAI